MIDRIAFSSAKRETSRPFYLGKKFRLYVITASLSLSFVLICGEILVRLFLPFNTPDTLRSRSLQYVGSIFSRHLLKPAQVVKLEEEYGSKRKGQVRNRGYFIVNAIGYRGPEFAVLKPKGVTRIVVVGGSSVFDQNVRDSSSEDANDWPHVVGRLLKNKGFENIEVINAGVPGHATFDALGRLYSQLWMYRPDYVLLYDSWNDIKYFRQLMPEKPLISLFDPLTLDSNPFIEYQGFWDRVLSYSQLYVKFRNQYYMWKFRVGTEGVIPEAGYQDHYSPYGVEQYRLNVQLIVDASRNIGATPILLTEPTLVSPNNSVEARELIRYDYQQLTHPALVKAFDDTYEVLRSVGKEKNVAVLDLAKEFNGKVELFTDAVHLTKKGSEKVADRVAGFLALRLEHHRVAASQVPARHGSIRH